MATNQMKNPNIFAASVLAGLLGASIAMLFAPKSGKETRDEINKRAKDVSSNLRDSMNQRVKGVREKLSSELSTDKSKNEENKRGKEESPVSSSVVSTWEEEV